jgi:hypothetical protein
VLLGTLPAIVVIHMRQRVFFDSLYFFLADTAMMLRRSLLNLLLLLLLQVWIRSRKAASAAKNY